MLFYHAGIHRNADPLYAVPQRRIVKHFVENTPLRVSSTRSLGAYANVFAIESFMDELAARGRRRSARVPACGTSTTSAPAPSCAPRPSAPAGSGRRKEFGRGRGIGFARYKNQKCYAAVVIDVRVDLDTAEIVLERAVIAADAGQIVDPSGLANQLEGGVIQSASWTLKEQVMFDRTRDHERRLGELSDPALRRGARDRDGPARPTRRALSRQRRGDAGTDGGAIANAVFDAIGVRLRDIPFTPDRVRAAVAAGCVEPQTPVILRRIDVDGGGCEGDAHHRVTVRLEQRLAAAVAAQTTERVEVPSSIQRRSTECPRIFAGDEACGRRPRLRRRCGRGVRR